MINAMHYMVVAFWVAGVYYNIPFCIGQCIGLLVGMAFGSVYITILEYKKINRDIKEAESQSKMLDAFSEYIKTRKYEPKIPDSKGENEQAKSGPK